MERWPVGSKVTVGRAGERTVLGFEARPAEVRVVYRMANGILSSAPVKSIVEPYRGETLNLSGIPYEVEVGVGRVDFQQGSSGFWSMTPGNASVLAGVLTRAADAAGTRT